MLQAQKAWERKVGKLPMSSMGHYNQVLGTIRLMAVVGPEHPRLLVRTRKLCSVDSAIV